MEMQGSVGPSLLVPTLLFRLGCYQRYYQKGFLQVFFDAGGPCVWGDVNEYALFLAPGSFYLTGRRHRKTSTETVAFKKCTRVHCNVTLLCAEALDEVGCLLAPCAQTIVVMQKG